MEKNKQQSICRFTLILFACFFFCLCCLISISLLSNQKIEDSHKFVIHAGGGFNNISYLNSQEGMQHYAEMGYTLFELDFIYTSDNLIACSHIFEHSSAYSFGKRPTYNTFVKDLNKLGFEPINFSFIKTITKLYPNITIIFDTKEVDKLPIFDEVYQNLLEIGFDVENHLIAQVYDYDNYNAIKNYKVKEFWFTNYLAKLSQNEIYRTFASEEKITTIVLPVSQYERFMSEGYGLNKKLALHSTDIIFTRKAHAKKYKNVDYLFIDG